MLDPNYDDWASQLGPAFLDPENLNLQTQDQGSVFPFIDGPEEGVLLFLHNDGRREYYHWDSDGQLTPLGETLEFLERGIANGFKGWWHEPDIESPFATEVTSRVFFDVEVLESTSMSGEEWRESLLRKALWGRVRCNNDAADALGLDSNASPDELLEAGLPLVHARKYSAKNAKKLYSAMTDDYSRGLKMTKKILNAFLFDVPPLNTLKLRITHRDTSIPIQFNDVDLGNETFHANGLLYRILIEKMPGLAGEEDLDVVRYCRCETDRIRLLDHIDHDSTGWSEGVWEVNLVVDTDEPLVPGAFESSALPSITGRIA